MESSISRYKNISRAKQKLKEIFENRRTVLLVHYSCESFVDNTKGSHRVTSIAVRRFDDGQTKSFSIFQVAEELKITNVNQEYEKIEFHLLKRFFDYAKTHEHSLWVHWNMRDINYGFSALEHRYTVLGGTPFILRDENKYDLPRILYARFGKGYAAHPHLESLMNTNGFTNKNFLNGQQEADAFKAGEYLKLHQSTLRKADLFDNILNQLEENSLKVQVNFFQIYGLNPGSLLKAIKEHWLFTALIVVSSAAVAIARLLSLF